MSNATGVIDLKQCSEAVWYRELMF